MYGVLKLWTSAPSDGLPGSNVFSALYVYYEVCFARGRWGSASNRCVCVCGRASLVRYVCGFEGRCGDKLQG
jgi:hypothetical protein